MSIIDSIKARLVEDWHQASKWWSVRLQAIGAVLLPALTMVPAMPSELQALLPVELRAGIAALWCVATIVVRLVAQKKPNG